MEVWLNEDKSRRIASKEHNIHIAEGFNEHNATSIAPNELLQPLSKELEEKVEARHREIESLLTENIGVPFYSRPGFLLYLGDCCDYMEKLGRTTFKVNLTITVRRQRLRHNQLMDTLVSCCILVKLPQSLVMLTSRL